MLCDEWQTISLALEGVDKEDSLIEQANLTRNKRQGAQRSVQGLGEVTR